MLNELFSLFFPSVCMACGESLLKGEECICTYCRYHLPQTMYHLERENPLIKNFWGKVPVHSAAAYYYFYKGEKVQRLLHRLKYDGRKDIGKRVGQLYGHDLKKSDLFNTADLIIPVPLYRTREKKRGYNQSTVFAEGLADSMSIEFSEAVISRIKPSETQTRKNRFDRWENVNEIFLVNRSENLSGRHVLLVDDVITTGATLEACAIVLHNAFDIKISIAAIACA